MAEDRANNPARKVDLPSSLGGVSFMQQQIPDNVSAALLPGSGVSKANNGVRVIDRSKDKLGLAHSAESYNKISTDVTNLRKSGDAAKYSASVVEGRNASTPKKTVKIKSN
jgi:hypothetical protein